MGISSLIEKWDTVAYLGYNTVAGITFALKYPNYRKYLKRNRELHNRHYGKRCFITLNGPSLNRYDLSKITNEFVICANAMYNTPEVDTIRPDYYCISDFSIFSHPGSPHTLDKVISKCSYSNFLFNVKHLEYESGIKQEERVYWTYNKHIPNILKIRNNLAGLSSNFYSVSLYAMNVAVYLGFKEVYLLGYDFEPGVFKHFYQESEEENEEYNNQRNEVLKDDVCGKYWQYTQAQYQNYYIRKFAALKGVTIYNCNENSCVRSFPFIDYKDIFLKDKEV